MALVKKSGAKVNPMDNWLEVLGFYRKLVAKDSSCLFRAVAEHVFNTQKFHLDVRLACVRYMEVNKEKFESKIDELFETYLEKIRSPKEWGSRVEIYAMSLMYNTDFIIFEEADVPPRYISNNFPDNPILLCCSAQNHFDIVYPKSYIGSAAFCQSILYKMLYKVVFDLGDEVDVAVGKMLHEKAYAKNRKDSTASQDSNFELVHSQSPDLVQNEMLSESPSDAKEKPCSEIKRALALGVPPFPYKVAKALDNDVYRNVEFDVWNDAKKAENQFKPGTKCLVKFDKDGNFVGTFHAHVQELHGEKGPVTVFIEELGRKETVAYDMLETLPAIANDSKNNQWRSFSKHFRNSSGYYQKNSVTNVAELDNYGIRKKPIKRKSKFPFDHCQSLPSRLTSQDIEIPPLMPNNNSIRYSSSFTSVSKTANVPTKWIPPLQITKHNHNHPASHFSNVDTRMASGIEDNQKRMNENAFEYTEQDFPPFSQFSPSAPFVQSTGVWCHPVSTSLVHQSVVNHQHSGPQKNNGVGENGDQEFKTFASNKRTAPIPIAQPSMIHAVPSDPSMCNNSVNMYGNFSPMPSPPTAVSPMAPVPQCVPRTPQPMPTPVPMLVSPIPPTSLPPPPPIHLQPPMSTACPTPPPTPMTYSFYPVSPVYPNVFIPYDNASQAVNYNAARSQDPSGNDLPLSDLPTLRFFFNLGCDYFRLSSMIVQQSPMPSPMGWNIDPTYSTFSDQLSDSDISENVEESSCSSNGYYANMAPSVGMAPAPSSSPAYLYGHSPYTIQHLPNLIPIPQHMPYPPGAMQ